MAGSFCIIAHRGDSAGFPENTFTAFDAAIDHGFHHFETDCQLTKDGVCIILHDEQMGRTCRGQGAVAESLWQDISNLDAGSWFSAEHSDCKIPTLEQLLKRYRGKIHLHLVGQCMRPWHELPVPPILLIRAIYNNRWLVIACITVAQDGVARSIVISCVAQVWHSLVPVHHHASTCLLNSMVSCTELHC